MSDNNTQTGTSNRVSSLAPGSVPSLESPREELVAYLLSLKAGERVVETSRSALWNRQGTVYINEAGSVCVLWDKHAGEEGQMGTTVTGGARRLSDIPNAQGEPRMGSTVPPKTEA